MTKHGKIAVVTYCPEWPIFFECASRKISNALGSNCTAIHHVGSTAIPGLCAKPIIDIIAVVKNRKQCISLLETAGYTYKGEYNIPGHIGFNRRNDMDVNLHVYEEGHAEISLNLAFRDYLRTHPKERNEYIQLKTALLKRTSSHQKGRKMFTGYTLGKNDFIQSVLRKAGFTQLRMLHCTHQIEKEAAKHYRTLCRQEGIELGCSIPIEFILYQGVDIIGYATIHQNLHNAMILIDEEKDQQGFRNHFSELIQEWIHIH